MILLSKEFADCLCRMNCNSQNNAPMSLETVSTNAGTMRTSLREDLPRYAIGQVYMSIPHSLGLCSCSTSHQATSLLGCNYLDPIISMLSARTICSSTLPSSRKVSCSNPSAYARFHIKLKNCLQQFYRPITNAIQALDSCWLHSYRKLPNQWVLLLDPDLQSHTLVT